MANTLDVRKQLLQAGFRNKYMGWSAINQLPMILEEDEMIERAISGMYEGGYAVILATNRRILFLDKKPFSFRAEDIHYEMVSEVEHYMGPIMAKLRIHGLSKSIELSSLHHSSVQSFAIHVEKIANQMRLNMSNVNTWSQMMDDANRSEAPQRPKRYVGRNEYPRL